MPTPLDLHFLDASPDHLFALWRNIFLWRWRKKASVHHAETANQHFARLAREHPTGFAVVYLIEAAAEAPDDSTRKAIVREGFRFRDTLRCTAVLIEGQGFQASTARAVTTALGFLLPNSSALKAFSQPSELATWVLSKLYSKLPESRPHAEMCAALEASRQLGH